VATSNAAFVDFFQQGPVGTAVKVTSWADFERRYGGLDERSEASYGIMQFFLNGGGVVFVVRAESGAISATADLPTQKYGYGYGTGYAYTYGSGYYGSGWGVSGGPGVQQSLVVTAASPGLWGNQLRVGVDYNVKRNDPSLFNLVVQQVQVVNNKTQVLQTEIYRNLSLDSTNLSGYAPQVVNQASTLVTISDQMLGGVPDQTGPDVINKPTDSSFVTLTGGWDGTSPQDGWTQDILLGDQAKQTGIYALEAIAPDIFNILCIPATALLDANNLAAIIPPIQAYCTSKRAMYILDLPASFDETPDYDAQLSAIEKFTNGTIANVRDSGTAVYFPRLIIPDPLNQSRPRGVGASGTLAGIWAATDARRGADGGVWKAPAGTQARLAGATLACNLTDPDNGTLNQLGVNVLRSFPAYGNLSWGARTLMGADVEASEWKYISIRRTAYYIEESLFEGLKWVVFEPNDEVLWRQIRQNVTAFLQDMYLNFAFPGQTPEQSYFVKCDADTNPQSQIDLGIVTIVVGFAPLIPAEFVIIQIEQMVGQTQS
jgi:phage tail sheath protein FI